MSKAEILSETEREKKKMLAMLWPQTCLTQYIGVVKRVCVCPFAVAYKGLKGEPNPLQLSSGHMARGFGVVLWVYGCVVGESAKISLK